MGNGISLIIMAGIISTVPKMFIDTFKTLILNHTGSFNRNAVPPVSIKAIFKYSTVPAPFTKVNAIANPCKKASTIPIYSTKDVY